jgi:hypothetical protein
MCGSAVETLLHGDRVSGEKFACRQPAPAGSLQFEQSQAATAAGYVDAVGADRNDGPGRRADRLRPRVPKLSHAWVEELVTDIVLVKPVSEVT